MNMGPRNFVIKNLPYLTQYLRGTIGFIGDCYCDHRILSKDESLDILHKIQGSKFRVKPEIVIDTIRRVEASA